MSLPVEENALGSLRLAKKSHGGFQYTGMQSRRFVLGCLALQIFEVGLAAVTAERFQVKIHIRAPVLFECLQQVSADGAAFEAAKALLLPYFAKQILEVVGGGFQ